MLITFKSKAAGDVLMFGDVAQQLLGVIGKPADGQGIVTVEQLPAAIARLRQAVAQSKAQARPRDEETGSERTPPGGERIVVSLAQRAVPLLELFEHSLKAKTPVTWSS